MTNVSPVSEMTARAAPRSSSPLVGEEGARAAKRRGKVRGNADGLTKRQLLPARTVARSRELRRNATDAEKMLWRLLRETVPGAKFRRQVPLGPYFADFCSHAARLVIEVDGGQHAEAVAQDAARTRFIEGEGYRVIRFWNSDVQDNPNGVMTVIRQYIDGAV
ncbi:endonuclease domain-containing protein [Stakelama saccharophila]|uniref:DUF559 domain-containing protein n=1 Tax=Stakelama saccharophila TaxID=3075605 RepID=A0ABZ0BB90_9SPHN|nr:DUF559 domain-containing protein [Stakelama sp. W311]WNO54697.1 DUF559 domain-containing protein [Stakelama sp. W311]